MAVIQKISGVLATTGPATYFGSDSQSESATNYDYLRIEGDDGREYYLERVVVPSYLDATLTSGTRGSFYIVPIAVPKLFGSHQVYSLFALSASDGKLRQAIPQAARCTTDGKIGNALRLFWYGTILMPAFGVGLLYWIAALRFILIKAPVEEMQQALQGTS